ncbi:MAG: hypothetical protein CMJ70_24330, partial [Planctomycetaceae bacterium]|nr:hypothetical protein [Planctomycetaceae bacterium]
MEAWLVLMFHTRKKTPLLPAAWAPLLMFSVLELLEPTLAQAQEANAPAAENGAATTIQDQINSGFEGIVKILAGLLFYEVPLGFGGHSAPFILLVLIFGGIFFTLRFGFINLRLFRHSIDVIRGKYDRPEDEGEITHFQALTSAL